MRRTRPLIPLLALTLAMPIAGCGLNDPVDLPDTTPATVETTTFAPSLGIDLNAAGWTRGQAGLYYRVLTVPTVPSTPVTNGRRVSVRYTGWLSNGSQFESSTYPFTLGSGEVIPGWDVGIVGMQVGEKRRLLIPPNLAYGPGGRGPIPGNAVLVFDVEVLSAT